MADENTKKLNVVSSAGASAPDATTDADDPFAETKKEIRTRFELLPEDIQKAIMDDGYQMNLFEIAKANKLTYEELGVLEMETTMVLLGMTNPADFRDEVQVQLKKNDPEIDTLVAAINEKVFLPIRASLARVYEAKKEPEELVVPAAVPSAQPTPSSNTAPINPTLNSTPKPYVKEPSPTERWQTSTPASTPAPTSTTNTPSATPRPSWMQPESSSPIMQSYPSPLQKPQAATTPSGLSSTEKDVLMKTGVVVNETPVPQTTTPQATSSRGDMLKELEKQTTPKSATPLAATPAPTTAPLPINSMAAPSQVTPTGSIITDKLTATGPAMQSKVTDYSLPKSGAVTPKPAADPYREPLE